MAVSTVRRPDFLVNSSHGYALTDRDREERLPRTPSRVLSRHDIGANGEVDSWSSLLREYPPLDRGTPWVPRVARVVTWVVYPTEYSWPRHMNTGPPLLLSCLQGLDGYAAASSVSQQDSNWGGIP
ncbi:hypothetical protein VTN77DRAFT_6445 [Rasamsonia byssochlamydoides]|uniref:uncharacterized protein n=1 Tax=Rasamsonia byssochlamydoides TaxID=89139 RepID=UPI00374264CE